MKEVYFSNNTIKYWKKSENFLTILIKNLELEKLISKNEFLNQQKKKKKKNNGELNYGSRKNS